MNTLLFQLLQTLNCQTLNNFCLCLSCSIFVLQSKLARVFSHLEATTELQHVSSGFPSKKRPGTRAITNSGQLQDNTVPAVCMKLSWFCHTNCNYTINKIVHIVYSRVLVQIGSDCCSYYVTHVLITFNQYQHVMQVSTNGSLEIWHFNMENVTKFELSQ